MITDTSDLPTDRPLRFELHLSEADYACGRELYICVGTQRGKQVCRLTVVEPVEMGDRVDATIKTGARGEGDGNGIAFLRAALDEAWRVGLRPSGWIEPKPDAAEARAALGAVKDHLQDMRRLVFKDMGGTA